ncbi:MAG: endonuclease domain-containing protein [Hyphomonadaceae bacterium]
MRNQRSIERARAMRREPTSAEAKLWGMLRNGSYRGIKFRRQHAIGRYVVDFAVVAARVVIEVDGPSHRDPEQAAFDAKRTAELERCGWRVVRLPNASVFAGGDAVYLLLDSLFRKP